MVPVPSASAKLPKGTTSVIQDEAWWSAGMHPQRFPSYLPDLCAIRSDRRKHLLHLRVENYHLLIDIGEVGRLATVRSYGLLMPPLDIRSFVWPATSPLKIYYSGIDLSAKGAVLS